MQAEYPLGRILKLILRQRPTLWKGSMRLLIALFVSGRSSALKQHCFVLQPFRRSSLEHLQTESCEEVGKSKTLLWRQMVSDHPDYSDCGRVPAIDTLPHICQTLPTYTEYSFFCTDARRVELNMRKLQMRERLPPPISV